MYKYLTPCKILLFAHMEARKEELIVRNNSSVYCLVSYQDVTKHVAKFLYIYINSIFKSKISDWCPDEVKYKRNEGLLKLIENITKDLKTISRKLKEISGMT